MSEPEVIPTPSEPKERVAHSFRSLRELVQLVDAFSIEAALAKLEQASAELGLASRAA